MNDDIFLETIEEIDKARENGLYMLALMGSLVLIDSCAKVEYPKIKGNKERYIKWYNKYICNREYYNTPDLRNEIGEEPSRITGEVVYTLRCSLLHEDNPNIQVSKIKKDRDKINDFVILIEEKNNMDIYTETWDINWKYDENGKPFVTNRQYVFNLQRFCWVVLKICTDYYKKHKDKFFFDYKLLDMKNWRGFRVSEFYI